MDPLSRIVADPAATSCYQRTTRFIASNNFVLAPSIAFRCPFAPDARRSPLSSRREKIAREPSASSSSRNARASSRMIIIVAIVSVTRSAVLSASSAARSGRARRTSSPPPATLVPGNDRSFPDRIYDTDAKPRDFQRTKRNVCGWDRRGGGDDDDDPEAPRGRELRDEVAVGCRGVTRSNLVVPRW